jgi:hypothetical protein
VSGVRQGGTRLSATSHRPVDRPELSFQAGFQPAPLRRPFDGRLSIVNVTTEYPANGSSNRDHTTRCVRRGPCQVRDAEENMVKPHG